jgi:hypothetical protein
MIRSTIGLAVLGLAAAASEAPRPSSTSAEGLRFHLAQTPEEPPTNYPVLLVWPAHVSFGQVVLGDSVTNWFTVKNIGGGIAQGTAGPRWSASNFHPDTFQVLNGEYSLRPGESHAVGVAYFPSGAAMDSVAMGFGNSEGAEVIATVGGSRLGTNARLAAVISVTPTNIDFGVVKFGETRTNYITVRNTGGALLRGSAHVGLELTREEMRIAETNALKRRFTPAPFDLISGNTYALGSNESQTVVVTYTPSGLLPTNRALVYFPGEGWRVETRTVTLSGAIEVP